MASYVNAMLMKVIKPGEFKEVIKLKKQFKEARLFYCVQSSMDWTGVNYHQWSFEQSMTVAVGKFDCVVESQ